VKKRHREAPPSKAKSTLGRDAYIAISAVEGLKLGRDGRKRISAPGSTRERRASVLRAYAEQQARK
jgi:hypothetical protein